MPVKRRLAKARAELTAGQLAYLRGEVPDVDGLPLLEWIEHAQMCERGQTARVGHPSAVELWAAVGAEFIAAWARERPGTRPSTWWRDAAPERPRRGETETECLSRLGLLLPAELRALGKTGAGDGFPGTSAGI